MERNRQNFFSCLTFFAQLPPNNPENQKFEKMEKTHGDIIILSVPKIMIIYDILFLRYGTLWM